MNIRTESTYIEGNLPKGPYLPCVSMAGRALLAGYPRYAEEVLMEWYRNDVREPIFKFARGYLDYAIDIKKTHATWHLRFDVIACPIFTHGFSLIEEMCPKMRNCLPTASNCWHDDVIIWKRFQHYWPFVRESTGRRWIPLTKASDAKFW